LLIFLILFKYKISLPCACDIAVLSQHIYFGSLNSRLNVTPLRDNCRMRRTPTCPCRIKTRYITAWWGFFACKNRLKYHIL